MAEAAYRAREFPHIEYRDTIIGRQAYIADTRLKVWHLVSTARNTGWDTSVIAAHYGFSHYGLDAAVVEEALAFAQLHLVEIDESIARNASYDVEKLRATLPNVRIYEVPDDSEQQ